MFLGKEVRIKALAREWTIPAEPTVGAILDFRDWITEREGDPFEELERLTPLMSKEDALVAIRDARAIRDQLRCFSLACPLAKKYLATEIGATHFTMFLLRQNHPDITLEQAFAVDLAIGRKQQEEEARRPKPQPEGNGLKATEDFSLVAATLGG